MKKGMNSKEYNDMLVRRGELTFYIEPAALIQAEEVRRLNNGKVGRPFLYGNGLVFAGFALKCLLRFGYRQISGTIRNILKTINTPTPNFRTLWRRIKKLKTEIRFDINLLPTNGEKIEIAIDSTGIKLVNDGEYRTKRYGKKKNWIKLHLSVDVRTGAALTKVVTGDNVGDVNQFKTLIEPISNYVDTVDTDGAYDSQENFDWGKKHDIRCNIPVRINSRRRLGGERKKAIIEQFDLPTDSMRLVHNYIYDTVERRKLKQKLWREKVHHGRRWMVEGAYAKFKRMFGEYVFSKKKGMVEKEICAKLYVYNRSITM